MSPELLFINFHLIPGIVIGSIYALGAIGVSLIFSILRFAHFAHGDMMTLGAYIGLTVVTVLGVGPILALPIAMALTAGVAIGVDRAFYRPFRKSKGIVVLIASFGVALMLRSAVQIIWGVQIESYAAGELSKPIRFFDAILISEKHLWIVGAALTLMLAVHLLLTRTRIGKAMRAVSDNADLARVAGIPTERAIRMMWLVGGGLAAAAGVFAGWDTQLQSVLGWHMLLPLFAAAILGGIGRPYGAMVGGLVIGLAEELSVYAWFGTEPLVSPGYKAGIAFAIMVIMLIVRPSGLFRGKVL